MALVKKMGTRSWTTLSKMMPSRSSKSCRLR